MKLFPSLKKRYAKEQLTATQAQRLAQEIAFGPVVFQVSRLMLKFGIFRRLRRPAARADARTNRRIGTPVRLRCASAPRGFAHHRHGTDRRRAVYALKSGLVLAQ